MKITVNDNQTILDIAVQYYGIPDAISEIMLLNPELANDVSAVVEEGYEPGDFYPHIKLKPESILTIDESSKLIRKNVVKKIDKDVTTYITE